ncbi:phage tail protein [Leuconostoc carnosum]|uniref:phage tail protein n=1 Tax=Leuconostoc carnosum TaxID=1252 RepID=UPI000D5166D9|nr:phage tail protein [Leuconostoc carnosum]SPJ44102.1 hypothetical protein LCAC16_80186 [Leuconostoc carnosum]
MASTLGIKNIKFAFVDSDNNLLIGEDGIFGDATDNTGIFKADQNTTKGVASVALSGLQGAMTSIWGSDQLVYVSTGTGEPSSVLTLNALPAEIKHRMLGDEADGKGGFSISGKSDADVRVAFVAESREAFATDKPVYVGFYAGIAQETATTMNSNNTAESRSQDAITVKQLSGTDGNFGKWFHSGAKNFDLKAVESEFFHKSTPAQG